MIVPQHRAFRPLALLMCGVMIAAVSDAAAAPAQPKDLAAWLRAEPMIFFVAKGAPNACGPGCSEWIAAEGVFDYAAGGRFRDFLAALPRRDLPIFFNSRGGSIGQAMAIGGIVRDRLMTAGVGRTLPGGCRSTVPTDDACRKVMQSKAEHEARLVTTSAFCFSACVYAFVGGSIRQVARDTLFGIHSPRLLSGAPVPLDGGRLFKLHMVDMGIDPDIVDAAAKVSADRIRFLGRDEFARFGIETRGTFETPWVSLQDRADRYVVLKSVTQAADKGGKEYRTRNVRISCVDGDIGIRFEYRREPASNEIGVPTAIRVTAGAQELELGNEASEAQSAVAGREFLDAATAAPGITITELFSPSGDAQGWSRMLKLSTNGLSKAVEGLKKDCGWTGTTAIPAVSSGP